VRAASLLTEPLSVTTPFWVAVCIGSAPIAVSEESFDCTARFSAASSAGLLLQPDEIRQARARSITMLEEEVLVESFIVVSL
jgi:hypothetical protein